MKIGSEIQRLNLNILKMYLHYKPIAILSILFSIAAMAIAFQNPAQGYELSIYDSTPSIVWFSLILSIIGALFIVIYQISTNKYVSNNFWTISIFILLLNRLILLYIPYIRGYFSWRGDNITHLGLLIDIIASGHTSNNAYPITHIFLAMVYVITGISRNVIVNYSTGIFSIFYVISIYLLATVILHTKKEQILAVTSAVVVFFSYNLYLMPNGWSQLYLPLLVFLYFKSFKKPNSPQYKLLLVLLLIMYPYFHPLSSLYVIFMLSIIGIATFFIYPYLYDVNNHEEITIQKSHSFREQLDRNFIKRLRTGFIRVPIFVRNDKSLFPLTAILIELTIFIPWVLSLQSFKLNLRTFYNSVLSGTSPEVIEGIQNTLNKINISGIDFISLLLKLEGANLIFLGLFAVSLFLLAKEKHNLQKNKNLLILSCITSFTGFIYAAYLFRIVPGLHAIAAERIKSYIPVFTPISAGFVFFYFFQKKLAVKRVNLFPILCIFIIFTASILSIYSLYPSPNVIHPTPSITQMDMKGAEWFVYHHTKGTLTTDIMSPMFRFMDGITGKKERIVMLGSFYQHTNVPDHFNYTEKNKLGESYLENRYMMITMYDSVIYDTVWSMIGRFNSQDFDQLSDDASIQKLYCNGETEIFFIYSMV